MNPITLTAVGTDTIYGYACGNCHNICFGYPQNNKKSDVPDDEAVRTSFENAEDCCLCWKCRAPSDENSDSGRCYACEKDYINNYTEWHKNREDIVDDFLNVIKDTAELSKDVYSAKLLMEKMGSFSQKYWCAGWLIDLEYLIWQYIVNPNFNSFEYGGKFDQSELDEMKELSDKAGGWWIGTGSPLWTKKFMPIEDWEVLFKQWEY